MNQKGGRTAAFFADVFTTFSSTNRLFYRGRDIAPETSMPRRRLRNLINSQHSAKPVLPLVHTTDVYRFSNVLDDGRLEPRECPVFDKEPLLYFFYGRPSYRANSKEAATALDHYLPVCLLFRSSVVNPIKRIFPFDSGGFHDELYADAFHKDMKLDDFGLEPDINTRGRVPAP
jgi:hypothetical protein